MDYNKIMIVTLDENSVLFSREGQSLGVRIERYFSKKTILQRFFSRIDRSVGTMFSYFFWEKWKEELRSIEVVILNSHTYSKPLIKYLNRFFPEIRVIIWYSNPISKDTPLKVFKELNCEIWSFDKEDCQKYHLRENNQFIDREMFNYLSNEIEYDLCFVGLDKGRLEQLLDLEAMFNKKEISTYLYIVDSNKNSSNSYSYKNRISYSELLSIESKSKALLDIVQLDQKGQTLRPIEALFLRKRSLPIIIRFLKLIFIVMKIFLFSEKTILKTLKNS